PKDVIATLHRATAATVNDPPVRKALTDLGIDVVGGTPEELRAYVKSEIPKWAEVVRASGAGLTRTCSFAAMTGGRKRHDAMPSEGGRDLPPADGRDSPQDDQCVSEPTGRWCVSTSPPPRAACSARRSQDCASVSQKGLSLSSTAARAIRKQSSALLR